MNMQTILPPEPYEGTEPYLFISYSHKNSNQVWSVIDAMQARGFRIWYDKGIQVGTEYNNIIAEKLEGCTVLLSFNTDELFASKYCMQELLYAANENKKIVNICFPLSKNPPRWYKLRFETTYQQIYRDRSATEEDFLDELCRADILQDCRGLPEKQTPAASGVKHEKIHDNPLDAFESFEYKKFYDYTLGAYAYQITGYTDNAYKELGLSPQSIVSIAFIIPAIYKGLPVTRIGDFAFRNCKKLTSIIVADSITSIGNGAFSCCESLTSITIPNSVTSIGNDAFSICRSLTSITIPSSVMSIGKNAFYECTGLTSITIPNSVMSIGNKAFYNCTSLTTITIPNSVTSVGDLAFHGCSFTSITIPNSVTSIGDRAFSGCHSLTSITVDKENTVYHSMDNCIIETATKMLIAGCKNSIIPTDGSVTSIGNAFAQCGSLTTITIPNSVTSIGNDAFFYCKSLTSISFDGTKAEWNKIRKGRTWDDITGAYTIHCTDGDISK